MKIYIVLIIITIYVPSDDSDEESLQTSQNQSRIGDEATKTDSATRSTISVIHKEAKYLAQIYQKIPIRPVKRYE